MSQLNQDVIVLSLSDRQLIEDEHARLEQFLCDLCDTCSAFMTSTDCCDCGKEKIASCQGRLPSFFYDFLDLVAGHFDNEEKIIGGIPQFVNGSDYLRRHQQEHAQILQEVKHQIRESTELSRQGNVAAAIRQFYRMIKDRFDEHIRAFDDDLLNMPGMLAPGASLAL